MQARRSLAFCLVALVLALLVWTVARGGGPREAPEESVPGVGHDVEAPEEGEVAVLPAQDPDTAAGPDVDRVAAGEARGPELVIEGTLLLGSADPGMAPVPLPGATLEIGPVDPPELFTAGAKGRFRIALPDRGHRPVSLLLSAGRGTDHIGWFRRIDFAEGVSRVEGVRVLLKERPRVTGLVVDPSGAPLADVSVQLEGVEAARSREDGRFVLEQVAKTLLEAPYRLEETLDGRGESLRTLDVEARGFDDDGHWQPVRITMIGTGTVLVRVESTSAGKGAPVAGLGLTLDVAPAETHGARDEQVFGHSFKGDHETTDEAGVARFESVPAGVRLRLSTPRHEVYLMRAHRAADQPGRARLVTERDAKPGDRHLLVRAGETLDLRHGVGRALRLVGRVLEADGTGSPEAELVLRLARDRTSDDIGPIEVFPYAVRTDAEGRFDEVVHLMGEGSLLIVHARSRIGERGSYSPFGGTVFPETMMIDRAVVDLAAAGDTARLDLRLEAERAIAGRVVDAEGQPVPFVQVACLRDDTGAPVSNGLAREASTRTDRQGTYRLTRLPPGRFQIQVSAAEKGSAVVRGVAPGTEDLELRLDPTAVARVQVRFESERPLKTVSFARGRLSFTGGDLARFPRLEARARFGEPTGFPSGAQRVVSGSTSYHARGLHGQLAVSLPPPGGTSFAAAPGLHWFGARGGDVDGRSLFPMGTGPVRVAAGEHEVTLRLVPAASLSGRVEGGGGLPLLLRLRSSSGEIVPCFGPGGELAEAFRTDSSGAFSLDSVPAVPLTVEVGTWSELERGTPRDTVRVHPDAGQEATVGLQVR